MKKYLFILIGAMLLTMVGVTSCSSDDIPVYDDSEPAESLYGEWRLVGWTEDGNWFEIDTNFVCRQHFSIEFLEYEENCYVTAWSAVNEIYIGKLTLNGKELIWDASMRGSTMVYGNLKENLFFEDHICDIKSYKISRKQLKLYYTDEDYFEFTKDFDDSLIQPDAWKNGVADPYVAEVTAISDGVVDVKLLQLPRSNTYFFRHPQPEGVCHFATSDLSTLSFDAGDKIAFRIVQYKRTKVENKYEFQLKVEPCKGSEHVTNQAGMMHYDNRMGWVVVDVDRGARSGASYFYPMKALSEMFQKEGLAVMFSGELYSTWNPPQIALGGSDYYYADIDAIELGPQGEEVPIDEAHFPDAAFRTKLIERYDWAADGVLTAAERKWVRAIDISDRKTKSLKGIEFFPNLIDLRFSGNNLEEVDLSGNTELVILIMDNGKLSSIDLSHNTKLTMLSLKNHQLKSIDLSKNTELGEFYLERNLLTSLDLTGLNRLAYISCFNNQIKGEAMDALIASLSSERSPQSFYGINTGDPDEGNVITKSQVSALQAKGWKVWDKSQGSSNLQQYPGSDE